MIYTTQRRRFVYDTWDNGSRLDRVMAECTLSITHCLRLNLQLHTIDLVTTCRISSFCTVAWQLARFQLTRRIARSHGDSWASCTGQMSFMSLSQQCQCLYLFVPIFASQCLTMSSVVWQWRYHSSRVVSASDCGVRGSRFESRCWQLCLSRQLLQYTVLSMGCAPLLQCLGRLSLPPFVGR